MIKNNWAYDSKAYWLGLREAGSTWVWENEGGAEFTHWPSGNWASGEPDGFCAFGPPCYCAVFWHQSMNWYDQYCDTDTGYVLCEANPITSP